ncbi:alpha/beta fold hydrolase [Marinobacter salsuginis]|uniref:alpha/beta fold hydrolase n=1 Tax=Marinobacter salsuginis TaxID=418719 RepID=UPI001D1816B0|nr:hypothetical protein [Marinobacter salsuginis]
MVELSVTDQWVIPALSIQFQFFTWDLSGHGVSAVWPGACDDITPEDLAQEALELTLIAGAKKFHLVGTSISHTD